MVKTINMNTGEGYSKITFPDSQPHITVLNEQADCYCMIICSITSFEKLMELSLVADAARAVNMPVLELHIPYLLGARYDRRINKGDSFDLQVIAKVINLIEADKVVLYDPHSNVSELLIKNSKVVTNELLVKAYSQPDAVLLIPDAGATKKAEDYPKWNSNIKDSVQCLK
jgi:ribose-phosphate pyrophosphokinase